MKKMLIAAISAIAVIASVVGCQVYDSQDNSVLYSAMNAQGEGLSSLQALSETLDEKCADLSNDADNTDDFYAIFDAFFSFDEFVTAATGIVANDTGFTGDSDKSTYNVDQVKEWVKANYISKTETRTVIIAGYTSGTECIDMVLFPTIGEYTFSGMYEKQYQLKWDWNSKKGR